MLREGVGGGGGKLDDSNGIFAWVNQPVDVPSCGSLLVGGSLLAEASGSEAFGKKASRVAWDGSLFFLYSSCSYCFSTPDTLCLTSPALSMLRSISSR